LGTGTRDDPWTKVDYNNIDPATGGGGWANLGTTIMDSFNLVRARLVPGPELRELPRSRWLRH
jgi:hypothetical protein